MFVPIKSESDLQLGDIVFCEVQPSNRFHVHTILIVQYYPSETAFGGTEAMYTIGCLDGRISGWCYIQHIHGKLFGVHRAAESARVT